jgi:hypothetical protein
VKGFIVGTFGLSVLYVVVQASAAKQLGAGATQLITLVEHLLSPMKPLLNDYGHPAGDSAAAVKSTFTTDPPVAAVAPAAGTVWA